MYQVYILYSKTIDKTYTGYTSDIEKRVRHHNFGLDRWSKRGIPWILIYTEKLESKTEAIKRERFLKTGKGRQFVLAEVAKVVTARV